MKTVLTIAGFDPSSGAGVTADLMVFAAHRLFGVSTITALTVQSTVGVASVHPVEAEVVRSTLSQLKDDLPIDGIKIGMLATAETVSVVAEFVAACPGIPVVLDPVLRSSSGRELLSVEGVGRMREQLLPHIGWVTPNLEELGLITAMSVTTREEMAAAGHKLREMYPTLTVLATGGHLKEPDDLLLTPQGEEHWLTGKLIATNSTHGTGCALSSAILGRLVLGEEALPATQMAKSYVAEAMRTATPMGRGKGPIHHLWPLHAVES